MAIKITRICDTCKKDYNQVIVSQGETVEYPVDFTCSDCVLELERLKDLNAVANNGRGVSCVVDIINALCDKNIATAKSIYQHDGDKIAAYTEIQEWCFRNFGCRTHLDKDCKDDFVCKDFIKWKTKYSR
jgi:hypothetical protein